MVGCNTLQLAYQAATSLNAQSAWLAGFFCGNGHFSLNRNQFQPTVGIAQKEGIILDQIASIWGGRVYFDKSCSGFVWNVPSKRELALILAYFQVNPLRNPYKTAKLKGFERLLRYLERGDHLHERTRERLIRYIDCFQSDRV